MNGELKSVSLQSLQGKWILLLTLPSIDTEVCARETHRFVQEASKYPNVQLVVVSRDLPFAQKRWCAAEGASNFLFLSDFREGAFGKNCGVLLKEWGLLARCVFLIDPSQKVSKTYLVPEVSHEPEYNKILNDLKAQMMVSP